MNIITSHLLFAIYCLLFLDQRHAEDVGYWISDINGLSWGWTGLLVIIGYGANVTKKWIAEMVPFILLVH